MHAVVAWGTVVGGVVDGDVLDAEEAGDSHGFERSGEIFRKGGMQGQFFSALWVSK